MRRRTRRAELCHCHRRILLALASTVWLTIGCASERQGLGWMPFSDHRLDEAVRAGQTVVLEFGASWCAPCAELDKTTFRDADVIKAAARSVLLKIDLSDPDSAEATRLRDRFRVTALPTFVFLRSDGTENAHARLAGFVTTQEFIRAIESADRE